MSEMSEKKKRVLQASNSGGATVPAEDHRAAALRGHRCRPQPHRPERRMPVDVIAQLGDPQHLLLQHDNPQLRTLRRRPFGAVATGRADLEIEHALVEQVLKEAAPAVAAVTPVAVRPRRVRVPVTTAAVGLRGVPIAFAIRTREPGLP
jgi:hypothetical protein